MLRTALKNRKILGFFFELCSKVRIKMASGWGLYESPDKIGLAEPKKSPHKDSFCQNIPLRGLSGVLYCCCPPSHVHFFPPSTPRHPNVRWVALTWHHTSIWTLKDVTIPGTLAFSSVTTTAARFVYEYYQLQHGVALWAVALGSYHRFLL